MAVPLLVAVPASAIAQTPDTRTAASQVLMVAGWVLAALLLGGALIALRRLGAAAAERQSLEDALATARSDHAAARAILDTTPVPRCRIDADGTVAPGPGFAALLGAGEVSDTNALMTALVEEDRAGLRDALDGLRRDGQSFNLTVRCPGGNRALDVTGRSVRHE